MTDFEGVRQIGPAPRYVAPANSATAPSRRVVTEIPNGIPASRARSLPGVALPEMDADPEFERRVDVVVDDQFDSSPRARGRARSPQRSGAPFSRSCTTVAPPSAARRAVSSSATSAWSLMRPRRLRSRGQRGGIEPGEGVVQPDMEAPGGPSPPTAASSPATPNATRASTAASNGSSLPARKQPVIAVDMQPVPVIEASSACPFATGPALAVRDVVDGSGDRHDDP